MFCGYFTSVLPNWSILTWFGDAECELFCFILDHLRIISGYVLLKYCIADMLLIINLMGES